MLLSRVPYDQFRLVLGGCGNLVTPLFVPPLSLLFTVSQSFGCWMPSVNAHEWPLVCLVLRTWNVTPAHLPWLCASETPARRRAGQTDTSHVKQTAAMPQPQLPTTVGNTTQLFCACGCHQHPSSYVEMMTDRGRALLSAAGGSRKGNSNQQPPSISENSTSPGLVTVELVATWSQHLPSAQPHLVFLVMVMRV